MFYVISELMFYVISEKPDPSIKHNCKQNDERIEDGYGPRQAYRYGPTLTDRKGEKYSIMYCKRRCRICNKEWEEKCDEW